MPLWLRFLLAFVFLVLGVLGLFLPVLQGGLFLFISFWLIFPQHGDRLLAKLKIWFAALTNKSG